MHGIMLSQIEDWFPLVCMECYYLSLGVRYVCVMSHDSLCTCFLRNSAEWQSRIIGSLVQTKE